MKSPMATIILSRSPFNVRLFKMSDLSQGTGAEFFFHRFGSFNSSIPIFNSDTDLTSGTTLERTMSGTI